MAWTPTAEQGGGGGANAFAFPLEGFDAPASSGGGADKKSDAMDMFENFADFDDMVFDTSDNHFSGGFQNENADSGKGGDAFPSTKGSDAFPPDDQFRTG
ncbi:hypothetical protein THAOC_10732, partial [Thalassiosira oceanica]